MGFMAAASMAVVAAALPSNAAVTQYTDRTSFSTAAGPLVIENFSGFSDGDIAPSSDLGPFTVSTNGFSSIASDAGIYNVNGSRFLYVQITADTGGGGPGSVTFTFDSAITAFGADFESLNNNAPRTYAVVGGTTFDPLPISPSFLGFVSDTAFTSVTFFNPLGNSSDDQFGVDNLSFSTSRGGVVPEPATWAMMIAGFGMAGATLRRRRAIPAA